MASKKSARRSGVNKSKRIKRGNRKITKKKLKPEGVEWDKNMTFKENMASLGSKNPINHINSY